MGHSNRETHSDSLTSVLWLREMAVSSDLGKGKELGKDGGQVRWKHRVKIPLSRSQSLGQGKGWQREVRRTRNSRETQKAVRAPEREETKEQRKPKLVGR